MLGIKKTNQGKLNQVWYFSDGVKDQIKPDMKHGINFWKVNTSDQCQSS